MKILLVCEDIPSATLGGLGKHVVALGNAFLAAGHEVVLMGQDSPAYEDCAEEVGFNGRFITGFGNPLRGWKERQLGFFNPWKRPYFAKRLAQAILAQAKEFDVVHYHGHQPMVGRYIPATVNFLQTRHDQGGDCITNVRFKNGGVCDDRAPDSCAGCIHPSPNALRTALSRTAVQRYRQETAAAYALHPVIFVAGFLRDNYRKTMPNADLRGSTVIHNFISEGLLATCSGHPEFLERDATTRVHVAGRLDEPKGIGALLELLTPRLPPTWRVDVYGAGPQHETISDQHASQHVRLHGHQPYSTIVQATRSATLVVVPSIWQEPCATTILEALRLGQMCFALRRGGTPELAPYGAPGQLRLFDDLPALVDALLATTDFHVEPGGKSADVHQHIAALLPIYAGGRHGG